MDFLYNVAWLAAILLVIYFLWWVPIGALAVLIIGIILWIEIDAKRRVRKWDGNTK